MWWLAVLVLVAGCGRIGFSARAQDGAAPPSRCPTCDLGLVARWQLDETSGTIAHDDVGGHDGVVTAPAQWAPGRVGGALDLATGYATIDWDLTSAVSSAFTVAMWVRPDPGGLAYDRYLSSYYWRGDVNRGALFMDNDLSALGLRCAAYLGGSWVYVEADDVLAPGAWQHLACAYDGAHLVAYVDGAEVSESDATGVFAETDAYPLVIGASVDETGDVQNAATGAFDDVRIYGRALSPDEIAALAAP